MKYLKMLFLLIIFSLTIPYTEAGFSVVTPFTGSFTQINLTKDYNNINNQILYVYPSQVFEKISYIDGFEFYCSKSVSTTGNYNLRIYDYNPNEIVFINRFQLITNFNIPASACLDYAYRIHTELGLNYDTSTFFALNKSIAIGIFATTTTGNFYTFGSPTQLGYYIPSLPNNFASISSVANTPVFFNENANSQIKSMPFNLKGNFILPQTPLPPPVATEPIIGDAPDIGNGTLPDFDGIGDTVFEPDFNNTIECPDCIGNETKVPGGLSTEDTSIGKTLDGLGYCKSGSCNIYDFFDFLYDIGWFLFLLSVSWILYKFIYLKYISR